MKKDLRIYSWGRRIEGCTVGEEGLGQLQSRKKDRGIYRCGRRILVITVGGRRIEGLTVGEEGLRDLQLGRTIGGFTVRKG